MAMKEEQETTITFARGDTMVHIYTANPVHLRVLRGDDRATERIGGDDWGQFTVPAESFDPLRGFRYKRKPMSEEQRAAASERMARARAAKK